MHVALLLTAYSYRTLAVKGVTVSLDATVAVAGFFVLAVVAVKTTTSIDDDWF